MVFLTKFVRIYRFDGSGTPTQIFLSFLVGKRPKRRIYDFVFSAFCWFIIRIFIYFRDKERNERNFDELICSKTSANKAFV